MPFLGPAVLVNGGWMPELSRLVQGWSRLVPGVGWVGPNVFGEAGLLGAGAEPIGGWVQEPSCLVPGWVRLVSV